MCEMQLKVPCTIVLVRYRFRLEGGVLWMGAKVFSVDVVSTAVFWAGLQFLAVEAHWSLLQDQ
jgi:hypothetical protein